MKNIKLLLLCLSFNIQAQIIDNAPDLTKQDLIDEGKGYVLSQIKQIDQLMMVYNNAINEQDASILNQIIDETYTLPANFKSSLLAGSSISFYDNTWYAINTCKVMYKGRVEVAKIIMKVAVYPPDARSEWVIQDVYAPFLDIEAECNDETVFIPPSANESGFIGLTKAFIQRENIKAYTQENYQADYLSIFLHLVKAGAITFVGVENTKYIFTAIDNYVFEVDYFHRKKQTNGWLISKVSEIANDKKETFLNQQYSISKL